MISVLVKDRYDLIRSFDQRIYRNVRQQIVRQPLSDGLAGLFECFRCEVIDSIQSPLSDTTELFLYLLPECCKPRWCVCLGAFGYLLSFFDFFENLFAILFRKRAFIWRSVVAYAAMC